MNNSDNPDFPTELGCIGSIPRRKLYSGRTSLEFMPMLTEHCDGARLYVKRDDCTGLAFGGNKTRQLEFYLGAAIAEHADTILITGAVQSNFVRMAAAGARKVGMACHIQLEERVTTSDPRYRDSGSVLIDKLLGATLHSYPGGEDEVGADHQLEIIAADLRAAGRRPYIIPLAAGHPPLGSLGYIVAAKELLNQISESRLTVNEIFVASGSGATHAGLLFGLRALGSAIQVTGVCVRREAALQQVRIRETCDLIATLLALESRVTVADINLVDDFVAPGYGVPGDATLRAIVLGAQTEGLMLDPVYTGKAMAAVVKFAKTANVNSTFVFIHTGGSPALFAYQQSIEEALRVTDDIE
jgi:D-cysteine desulfhydrase family pyridoxal phosphate-dependent enzyme